MSRFKCVSTTLNGDGSKTHFVELGFGWRKAVFVNDSYRVSVDDSNRIREK